ncbi:hypothetical protein, partial [Candidatus Enterococcus willemsii]|uniref:hypothetical protein n=1 Tax=Candidatus Enterococcus willemsii TaxID=1857215 RepID=UPI001F3040CE
LKNLLSFLELEPKKNGLIFFIKPIIKLIITSIIIPIIVKISNMLVDNNNSFKVVTEKFTIRNIIVNVIQHPVLNYIILVILLVLVIFISIYKNEQIDDPHMKEYLKKSLTRAIEIKEENNAVGLHCESTAESLEKTEL